MKIFTKRVRSGNGYMYTNGIDTSNWTIVLDAGHNCTTNQSLGKYGDNNVHYRDNRITLWEYKWSRLVVKSLHYILTELGFNVYMIVPGPSGMIPNSNSKDSEDLNARKARIASIYKNCKNKEKFIFISVHLNGGSGVSYTWHAMMPHISTNKIQISNSELLGNAMYKELKNSLFVDDILKIIGVDINTLTSELTYSDGIFYTLVNDFKPIAELEAKDNYYSQKFKDTFEKFYKPKIATWNINKSNYSTYTNYKNDYLNSKIVLNSSLDNDKDKLLRNNAIIYLVKRIKAGNAYKNKNYTTKQLIKSGILVLNDISVNATDDIIKNYINTNAAKIQKACEDNIGSFIKYMYFDNNDPTALAETKATIIENGSVGNFASILTENFFNDTISNNKFVSTLKPLQKIIKSHITGIILYCIKHDNINAPDNINSNILKNEGAENNEESLNKTINNYFKNEYGNECIPFFAFPHWSEMRPSLFFKIYITGITSNDSFIRLGVNQNCKNMLDKYSIQNYKASFCNVLGDIDSIWYEWIHNKQYNIIEESLEWRKRALIDIYVNAYNKSTISKIDDNENCKGNDKYIMIINSMSNFYKYTDELRLNYEKDASSYEQNIKKTGTSAKNYVSYKTYSNTIIKKDVEEVNKLINISKKIKKYINIPYKYNFNNNYIKEMLVCLRNDSDIRIFLSNTQDTYCKYVIEDTEPNQILFDTSKSTPTKV